MLNEKTDNVVSKGSAKGVKEKSYKFALKIIDLVRELQKEQKEFILSGQLLRSGTSVGANIVEANAGVSKKDFAAKMAIASKEARETGYWLNLLRDAGFIDEKRADSVMQDCDELIRMLTSIVKTSKKNIYNSKLKTKH